MFEQQPIKNGGYTLTNPKKWSKEEEEYLIKIREKGVSLEEISKLLRRYIVSIQIKLKRIGKKNKNYNVNHINEKYETNKLFLDIVQPKNVLDLYSGEKSYYQDKIKNVTSNDKNKLYPNLTYNLPAELLIHKLYFENNKYDLIDLDPFGSAFECFDLAIKMANKALIITFGEIGHKRFKRLDFVKRYYGINTLDEFNIDKLIKEIQKIALRNKKELIIMFKKDWNRISRVYFLIKTIKITEQWDKK